MIEGAHFGKDERFRVYPSISPPYKWICYLEIESESGSKWIGSGFKINVKPEVGHQVILTSAHCTYIDGDEFYPSKLAKKITVYFPGQVPQVATSAANQLWACPEYIQYKEEDKHRASQDHNYGLIKLPGSSEGGFGWSAIASDNKLFDRVVTICGYPGDKRPTGQLWITGGKITGVKENRIYYKCDTYGGQSGSPVYTWLKGYWTVVGIHCYGGYSNSATRIRPEMIENITKHFCIKSDSWGLRADPQH